MRKLIILCVALMMISSIPTAMAITVDGNKSPGEWNENWAFGQENASTYSPNGPFGDRMVVRQGGYDQYATDLWYDTDPKDDSGPGFDISMATLGESSGLDISRIYAHYDLATDTLYGLPEVYGRPGDVDGDDFIGTSPPADYNGTAGPAGFGHGPSEFWYLRVIQGTDESLISLIDNNWSIISSTVGLTYGHVEVKFTTDKYDPANPDVLPKSCFEIKISNFGEFYNVDPGAEIVLESRSGSSGDVLGEETATVFVRMPDPKIDIEKSTNGDDADSPTGPILNMSDTVIWEYVITNTGDVPLDSIVVTDNKEGNIGLPQTTLEPSESMAVTASGTVTAYGQYANLATVVGNFMGIPVTDDDPSHYLAPEPHPDIDLEKHTNGHDADNPRGPYLNMGGTVNWEYIVTNTGDVTLSNIVVIDDKIGAITLPNTTLVSGDSMTGTATGTVTDYGQYENEAEVTGDYNAITVSDIDPSHYYCEPPTEVPALTPAGLMGLIGLLGIIGIIAVKRRN